MLRAQELSVIVFSVDGDQVKRALGSSWSLWVTRQALENGRELMAWPTPAKSVIVGWRSLQYVKYTLGIEIDQDYSALGLSLGNDLGECLWSGCVTID